MLSPKATPVPHVGTGPHAPRAMVTAEMRRLAAESTARFPGMGTVAYTKAMQGRS